MESNCLLPVDIFTTRFLWWPSSTAVMNPDVEGCATSTCQLSRRDLLSGWRAHPSSRFVENAHLALLNCFFDLLNLHLTEAFDLEKCLASCGMDRLQKSHFQPA